MSLKDFQFLGKLGEGAFSSVYKVKRMIDNQIYAIKKVKMNNLSQRQKENALNQVRILASISHPNIIAYKEAFIDKSTNFLYIIMEFADDGDLYAKINQFAKQNKKFTQQEIWSMFIQITRGLKALHQLRILHRDLKSANVFVFKDGSFKLGDMNVSKLAKSLCKTQTGTPYYASPQVWKDSPYDKKSDIWSLGCVLYQSIALKPPFRANDMEGLFKKVTRGFYSRIPPQYSDELNSIVKMLLQVTPHLRPTCDRLLQLPVVVKHMEQLPQQFQGINDKQKNSKMQLLKTIKLSKDSKDNIDLQMPRPRYASTIQVVSPVFQKMFQEFPKGDERRFPSIGKQHPVVHWNQKSEMVKKLTQPSDTQQIAKSLKVRQKQKFRYDQKQEKIIQRYKNKSTQQKSKLPKQKQREKLPRLYGRLKSMSPETIKMMIKKQKQKQKLYSIIGKNM